MNFQTTAAPASTRTDSFFIRLFHKNTLFPYACIAVMAVIAHGLLLLNDGVYWDGWLIYTYQKTANWKDMHAMFSEAGVPIVGYLHWYMGKFPSPVLAYQVATFFAVFVATVFIYRIGVVSKLISRGESLSIAVLSLVYPAYYQSQVSMIMLPFALSYCMFFLGAWMALRTMHMSGILYWLVRFSSLVILGISFIINSLLVFYFGFLALFFVCLQQKDSQSWRTFLRYGIVRYCDYVLLPFIYWISFNVLYPKHGLYHDYNQIHFFTSKVIKCFFLFIGNSVFTTINESLLVFLKLPLLLAIIILIIFGFCRVLKPKYYALSGPSNPCSIMMFGVALFCLGIFPYLVVGKRPSTHGFDTRHALLVALPMAILIVAVIRLLFTRDDGVFSKWGWVVFFVLMIGFSISIINSYVDWQVRWIKDRSIMRNLADIPEAKAYSVFVIDDRFSIGTTQKYSFYEWSSMFKHVWGDEKWFGVNNGKLNQVEEREKAGYFTTRYSLSNFDPNGPQAKLIIQPGNMHIDRLQLCEKYMKYRLFKPQGMDSFLKSVTQVEVTPFLIHNLR